ncbi:hypothetical protein [Variovorax sp. PAMC 28711]|uniref:hypothetical protein n=1 Tax=Variovorax sp. PAMC 28711 TaxID=1795631 RepID=UPI00078C0153|nr:hypothetical protein [Variovorax sp. PAMC 28711]AMM25272.1 hypothetical protein AX767_13565 [Variovorax sp. PAMC 28711]
MNAPTMPGVEAGVWGMQVNVAFTGLGGTRYHADLFRQGDWVARIAMAQASPNHAAAERILSERCRDWIARHEERERTGDTSFQILRD